MARLFELLTADPHLGEVRHILLDSTIVRAHVHTGEARRKKGVGGAGVGPQPGRLYQLDKVHRLGLTYSSAIAFHVPSSCLTGQRGEGVRWTGH